MKACVISSFLHSYTVQNPLPKGQCCPRSGWNCLLQLTSDLLQTCPQVSLIETLPHWESLQVILEGVKLVTKPHPRQAPLSLLLCFWLLPLLMGVGFQFKRSFRSHLHQQFSRRCPGLLPAYTGPSASWTAQLLVSSTVQPRDFGNYMASD